MNQWVVEFGQSDELVSRIYAGGDDAVKAIRDYATECKAYCRSLVAFAKSVEPRWIPVEEYMPELGARVMIANANDKWVSIGERAITGAYYHWRGDHDEELYDPTHWRLLPELPEVK